MTKIAVSHPRTGSDKEPGLVRRELEPALKGDIPVVPIPVDNATTPPPSDLPDGLQDFAYRNSVKVDALQDFDDQIAWLLYYRR